MGFLDRFRAQDAAPERVITPNRAVRAGQLMQLEGAILDVMDEMDRLPQRRNPGWQAQVQEFNFILATIRQLRAHDYDWSDLVDMAFEVRPVLRMRPVPAGMEHLDELQHRMMRIADALGTARPDEVQG